MEKEYLGEIRIAEEFLDAARKNMKISLRTSANRLYFAMEKAVLAYFCFKKIKIPKNHQKIWELSGKLLGEEYYSLLRALYDLRLQADYGSVSVFSELNVDILSGNLSKVEFIIKKLKLEMKND